MAFRTNKVPVLQEKSASGAVATFNTALAMPLASCNIAVNAWQEGSGEPSPDNVRTINGYSAINISATGKNLLDTSSISGTFAGVTYTNANGIVTINGTKLGSSYVSFTNARVSMRAGISYTFSINLLSGTIRNANQNLRNLQCYLISTNDVNMGSIIMYDTETIKSITVTPEEDIVVYPRFAWWSDNTIITDLQLQMQIELGTTATAYEAYNGTTTTIQIGSTVYGGTFDAITGILTVTHGFVEFNGTENWINVGGSYPQAYQLDTGITNAFQGSLATQKANNITNLYPWASDEVEQYAIRWQIGLSNGRLYVYDNNYTSDLAGFTQHLSDTHLQVVYLLNAPITIQLTPTQIETIAGKTNTIFADTGDVDLTYKDLDIAKRGNFREVFKLPS